MWQGVGYSNGSGVKAPVSETAVIQRITADQPVIEVMKQRMHPGMVLVTTDLPASPDTRTGKDFVVMATEIS
jgi:hypothetical protein